MPFGDLLPLRKLSVNVSSNASKASPGDLDAWPCGQMILPSHAPDARSQKVLETNKITRILTNVGRTNEKSSFLRVACWLAGWLAGWLVGWLPAGLLASTELVHRASAWS